MKFSSVISDLFRSIFGFLLGLGLYGYGCRGDDSAAADWKQNDESPTQDYPPPPPPPRLARYTGLYTGPYFDPTSLTNITAQLGTHAYLPCRVKQLGNKSVSWVRKRDSHILTVDRYTFIADERFQAFHSSPTDTWTLQVKYVQARDAGHYECQVSTEPKMSHLITLHVIVPNIEIMGESDLYVRTGSSVSLRCVITQSLEEPAYIFWYHDEERVLNFRSGRTELHTERISKDTTIGMLTIKSTEKEDSGNYTCSPSNLASASVMLHVLNGEHPAAMQHGKSGGYSALSNALVQQSERTHLLRPLSVLFVFFVWTGGGSKLLWTI